MSEFDMKSKPGSQSNDAEIIDADEAGIEDLLRSVGPRDEPSAEMMAAVRDAVHGEWRSVVQARTRRRQTIGWSMAAGVAAVVIGTVAILRTTPEAVPVEIASITRIDGRAHVNDDQALREASSGEHVRSGTLLTTDAESRVALDIGGVSVRVDSGTTLLMASADRWVLRAGAIYVDAPPGKVQNSTANVPLVIDTVAGSVRHVGTQYLVRTIRSGVEISVREGRVEVTHAHGTSQGDAGERLRVSNDGELAREKISALDPQWRWATSVAPGYDIANSNVNDFLEWAARETGRRLSYASDAARQSATTVKLHGSIAGLDPETALVAVLATTGLQRAKTDDELLTIDLRRD